MQFFILSEMAGNECFYQIKCCDARHALTARLSLHLHRSFNHSKKEANHIFQNITVQYMSPLKAFDVEKCNCLA